MNIVPRVAASAQSALAYGSPVKRVEKVDKLCDEFGSWLLQRLSNCHSQSNNPKNFFRFSGNLPRDMVQISNEDVQKYCEKKHPDVQISIASEGLQSCAGIIKDDAEKTVCGLHINIPLLRYRENLVRGFKDTVEIIAHEYFHLVDQMINPKKSAREIEIMQTLSETTQKNAIAFYKTGLYNSYLEETGPALSKDERIENLCIHINNFFNNEGLSSNNRITLLQHWRNNISSEQGAYPKGAEMADKATETILSNGWMMHEDRNLFLKFDYTSNIYLQKYNLLCNMLREEIASHRKAHVEALHSKQKSE